MGNVLTREACVTDSPLFWVEIIDAGAEMFDEREWQTLVSKKVDPPTRSIDDRSLFFKDGEGCIFGYLYTRVGKI